MGLGSDELDKKFYFSFWASRHSYFNWDLANRFRRMNKWRSGESPHSTLLFSLITPCCFLFPLFLSLKELMASWEANPLLATWLLPFCFGSISATHSLIPQPILTQHLPPSLISLLHQLLFFLILVQNSPTGDWKYLSCPPKSSSSSADVLLLPISSPHYRLNSLPSLILPFLASLYLVPQKGAQKGNQAGKTESG